MTGYELGILFSIGSVAEGKMVLRHKHRYFLERIQKLSGNTIYVQRSNTNVQYVLKTSSIDIRSLVTCGWTDRNAEERWLPILDDYRDFLRAYIELHSRLDYSTRYRRKPKEEKYRGLRLRIYGNIRLINEINNVLHDVVGIGIKATTVCGNGKTSVLSYTSYGEIDKILNYVSGEPCFPEFWKDADIKLKNPILEVR